MNLTGEERLTLLAIARDSIASLFTSEPPRRHERISHFLTNFTDEKIIFDPRSAAMNFLHSAITTAWCGQDSSCRPRPARTESV